MYIAFDIGCIECGEPSGIIGIFDNKDMANAACDIARSNQQLDWHGQHGFRVFDTDNVEDYSVYREEHNGG